MPQRGLAWQLGSQTVLTRLVSAIEKFTDQKPAGGGQQHKRGAAGNGCRNVCGNCP